MDPRASGGGHVIPADQTPNPIQSSPEPEDSQSSHSPAVDEIQYLKDRLNRQEELMEKMMKEMTLLRKELNSSQGAEGERRTAREGAKDQGSTEQQPTKAESASHSLPTFERSPLSESASCSVRRNPMGSAGAQFVAELSELIELDDGQHALLASVMDNHLSGRRGKRYR